MKIYHNNNYMNNNMNNMNYNMNNNWNNMNNNMNNMNNNMFMNGGMNNHMNNNMFMNMNILNLDNENFNYYQKGKKKFFRQIIKINKKYFLVASTMHIKNNNGIISNYFYISLFSFSNLEEISKIELIKFNSFIMEKDINIKMENDIVFVSIISMLKVNTFKFLYKNAELIEYNS